MSGSSLTPQVCTTASIPVRSPSCDLVAEHESIVYLEAGDQGWYAEGSDEVKGYVLSWDRIQAAALSAEESSALRLSIAKELDNG
ncbi:Scr1 family TA system antitoxin-like transcriptional regulator [Nocardia seriolae]|uniref:Scr1 family TA system antitoxin-like transcriptional regulator n=1 Tax=Nocardia seriolae TaxID=37332 RepID=UPI0039AF22F6